METRLVCVWKHVHCSAARLCCLHQPLARRCRLCTEARVNISTRYLKRQVGRLRLASGLASAVASGRVERLEFNLCAF